MQEPSREPRERSPDDDPQVPDLHLEEWEARARRAPAALARRADEAIARHAPRLAPSKIRGRFRRRTVALLALLGTMAALASVWAVLRQTSILRETLASQLSERFGAQVKITDVDWNGWNTIVATGLTLQVPGWPGTSGEVASIRRAVVVFEPLGLLAGNLDLVDMEVDGLTLRVIERADAPGTFNLFGMKPKNSSDSGPMRQPQKALLHDLRLEFGVLRGEEVEWFASQAYEGSFEHTTDDPTVYSFSLVQREEDGKALVAPPMSIFGTWNERTFAYEATLEGLDLGPEARKFLPLEARAWAARSGISGRVEEARIQGSAAHPVAFAEIAVRDLVLRERDIIRSLPWGRMVGAEVTPIGGDLTVTLEEGTLTVRGSEVSIAAKRARLRPGRPGSETVEIPVDLSMSIDLDLGSGLPFDWDSREDWVSDALALAKFDVHVQLSGLDARPRPDGSPKPIELPMAVLDALRDFGARDWAAEIDLSLRRAAPTRAADGTLSGAPTIAKGAVTLLDGSVRYKAFPYQLDHVRGTIEIDGTRATIKALHGKGTGDATFVLSGVVDAVGSDPGYDLRIDGKQILVDERLTGAFREAPARIFTTLFDHRAWQALHDAGLADEASRPGGLVDFDLKVQHAINGGETIAVLGDVIIHHAQMVLDSFPYPMSVQGAIRLEDEQVVVLGDGVHARTPAGGVGTVSGTIGIPREGTSRRVENRIAFNFKHERLARAMLAAVPASFTPGAKPPQGWPGKVYAPISQLLLALGAEGELDIDGTVRTMPDRSERVETTAHITNATIVPNEELPRVMRSFGLAWPGTMGLNGVSGTVSIAPEGLVLSDLRAERAGGSARAQGRFSTDGELGSLEVDLANFPIERDFIRIAGDVDSTVAARAWDALRPSGTFDGGVVWKKDGTHTYTWAYARPTAITLVGSVPLVPQCGQVFYRDGQIDIDAFDLSGPDVDDTPLRILADGRLTGPDARLDASVLDIAVDNPLVQSAIQAAGLDAVRETVREWELRGRFDAEFRVRPSGGDAPWGLTVAPHWVSGVHHGRAFSACVQSGGVHVSPDGAHLEDLTATIDRGWIVLDGAFRPTEQSLVNGSVSIQMLLNGWSQEVAAVLPLAAREALDQIGFSAQTAFWTDQLVVSLDVPREGETQVGVRGLVGIADGIFEAGTRFDRADGVLTFDLATDGGQPSGRIDLGFDRVRFIGRTATDVAAALLFDGEGTTVSLDGLHGSMYGGRIVGRAVVDPGMGYELHMAFVNIGFASFTDAPNYTGDDPLTDRATATVAASRQGALRGRFDVRGSFDDPAGRRGAGRAAVVDGKMVSFPLGLSILQLTQLMLPLSASLDKADIDFTLTGSTIHFETLDLSSGTMRLEGDGQLDLDDGEIALRFRNRGQVPILSDLYGVVADQLFVIDVGGTFRDPQPKLTPIPVFSPGPALEPRPAATPPAAAPSGGASTTTTTTASKKSPE